MDIKERTCEICDKLFSTKSNLKQHLKFVHGIGDVENYVCEICGGSTRRKRDHFDHLWFVHGIGEGKIFTCEKCVEEKRDEIYTTKRSSDLGTHIKHKHSNIRDEKFKCQHCAEKDIIRIFKSTSNLNAHIRQVHGIGNVVNYKCEVCGKESRRKGDHKKHLEQVHDIGDKQCEMCLRNCFCLTNYNDEKTEEKMKICRDCYNKCTGYSTSKEKQMVEYVKKKFPYLILQDQIIKGDSCSTKRRPDLLIGSDKELLLNIECDEYQHTRTGYNKECITSRINEILDELPSSRVVIICWNPDKYKKGNKSRKERLELLEKLIDHLVTKDWDDNDSIHIYYMFYDEDNETITTDFSKSFIYDEDDFQK